MDGDLVFLDHMRALRATGTGVDVATTCGTMTGQIIGVFPDHLLIGTASGTTTTTTTSTTSTTSTSTTTTQPTPCATRTQGFWSTHLDYAEHILDVHLGGSVDLGWVVIDSIEDYMGVFWASIAQESDGTNRDQLCRARVQLAVQALAAVSSAALSNGCPVPVSLQEIQDTICGTDSQEIEDLKDQLDAFNNSNDDVPIIDVHGNVPGPSNPQEAQDAADETIVDCHECT